MIVQIRLHISLLLAVLLAVSACGIPQVDSSTISGSPASAKYFTKAQKAVEMCSRLPDREAAIAGFRSLGYNTSHWEFTTRSGKKSTSGISLQEHDDQLFIYLSETSCIVGLKNMTPQQSYQLAQPWVRKYRAIANEKLGQGLSDHAVQAWQTKPANGVRVLISAGKTWHWDSNSIPETFRKSPGASVRLIYLDKK